MLLEFLRLLLGLTIAFFHRPIAAYMTEQERCLVVLFRQRGVPVPGVLNAEFTRNIYFAVGIFVAVLQLVRIYLALHGLIAV